MMFRKPITNKEIFSCEFDNIRVCCVSMQGYRDTMEVFFSFSKKDETIIRQNLPENPSCSFFGVFDGHGGQFVSHQAY